MSELEVAGHSDRVAEHIERLAAKDGFPWVNPPFLPKTHLALVLGEMARDLGEARHTSMHQAIFGAYFGDALDIGKRDILLAIAEEQGFTREEVERVWAAVVYDERLEQFRHLAINMGLDSTPAALICNELLIGSRPYGVFKDAVDRCLVTAENVEEIAGQA